MRRPRAHGPESGFRSRAGPRGRAAGPGRYLLTANGPAVKLTIESKRTSRAGVVRVRFLPREDCRRIDPPPAEAEFSGKARQLLYQRDQGLLYVGLGARKAVNGSQALRQAARV